MWRVWIVRKISTIGIKANSGWSLIYLMAENCPIPTLCKLNNHKIWFKWKKKSVLREWKSVENTFACLFKVNTMKIITIIIKFVSSSTKMSSRLSKIFIYANKW